MARTNILSFNGKFIQCPMATPSNVGVLAKISRFDQSEFYDIGDIYSDLTSGDLVGFVIRHSEYEVNSNTSVKELTPDGIQYAINTGVKLSDGIAVDKTEFSLFASQDPRCIDTATYIAQGTGLFTGITPEVTIDENLYRNPYEITKPSTGWEDYSLASYGYPCLYGGVFSDMSAVTTSILGYLKSRMTNKVNLFITHDQQLEMFTVAMCNQQIGLRFWNGAVNDGISEKRWITYLAGMAIIKRADGSYEYYPVKSLDKGFQRNYENIYTPG